MNCIEHKSLSLMYISYKSKKNWVYKKRGNEAICTLGKCILPNWIKNSDNNQNQGTMTLTKNKDSIQADTSKHCQNKGSWKAVSSMIPSSWNSQLVKYVARESKANKHPPRRGRNKCWNPRKKTQFPQINSKINPFLIFKDSRKGHKQT